MGPALAPLASGLAVLPRELNAGRLSPSLSARETQVLTMVVIRKLGVSSRKDARIGATVT